MSEANLKLVYERVIKDVRSDLEILKKMYAVMASKIGNRAPNEEAQKWIMDVYVDKLYQIEQKLNQIFRDIPTANLNPGNTKNVTTRLAVYITWRSPVLNGNILDGNKKSPASLMIILNG